MAGTWQREFGTEMRGLKSRDGDLEGLQHDWESVDGGTVVFFASLQGGETGFK